MIRLVNILRRKAGMSFEEFNHYWLSEHGPKVVAKAESLGIERYVQLHSTEEAKGPTVDPLRGEMLTPFDGVAEYWFKDMAAVLDAEAKSDINDALFADEQNFIDHAQSAAWIAYEVPHINPTPENIVATPESNLVRLFYVLNQPASMSIEDTQFYWRVQHGPLVRSVGQEINTLRYIQVHRFENEYNQRLQTRRGYANPYYGHAELWFDLSRSANEGAKAAGHMLYEDETHFIDFSRSGIWYGKEHVLV